MAVELTIRKFCTGVNYARFAIQSNCFNNFYRNFTESSKCFNRYPRKDIAAFSFADLPQNEIIHSENLKHRFRRKLVQESRPSELLQQLTGINCNIAKDGINSGNCNLFENSSSNLFRHLDSSVKRNNETENLLHGKSSTLEYLKGVPRTFFFRRQKSDDDEKKPNKRIPKLILVQNPFTWFMTKLDFVILKSMWDPAFTEKQFQLGTRQAIAKVTNVISDGQYSELNGLLTKAARLSLMRELERTWSSDRRALLALQREDIQISSPRKVYFIRIADKRYCDVDMAFLALKWAPIRSIEALLFTEIFARFHREYTPNCIPEWTIAYFKVTRFEVLRRKARN